ncbi:MAG: hypothetical protein OEV42_12940 [Deltaproteobacteria bacterium]|nr:hypothetical protein [Deltaproteobacteria bacterium]
MTKFIIFICINLLFISANPSFAETDLVQFAKALTARDYDDRLPSIPIEQWLSSTLPKNCVAYWNENITACGEQTGNPSIDRARDLPLCAAVELMSDYTLRGYLLLFVATEKKGKIKKPSFYFGYIKSKNKTIYIKKLGEIKKLGDPGRSRPAKQFAQIDEEECIFDQKEQLLEYKRLEKQYAGSEYIENEYKLVIPKGKNQVHLRKGGCVHYGMTIELVQPKTDKYRVDKPFFSEVISLLEAYGQDMVDMKLLRKLLDDKQWTDMSNESGRYFFINYEDYTSFEIYERNDDSQTIIGVNFYN